MLLMVHKMDSFCEGKEAHVANEQREQQGKALPKTVLLGSSLMVKMGELESLTKPGSSCQMSYYVRIRMPRSTAHGKCNEPFKTQQLKNRLDRHTSFRAVAPSEINDTSFIALFPYCIRIRYFHVYGSPNIRGL